MRRLIKKFADNSILEYDKGKFDNWCIYSRSLNNQRSAIKDLNIFESLDKLGQKVGSIKLYQDFTAVYVQTTVKIMPSVLQQITALASKHGVKQRDVDFLLTYLYAAMVAEENKDKTILKKRIKRLGVHQLLVEERPPKYCANFSRGKHWKDIDVECKVRGF